MFFEDQELNNVEEKEEVVEVEEEEETIEELIPSSVLKIEKPNKDTPKYDEAIEKARLDFANLYRKGRMSSYIAMGVVVALAIGSVVCIGFQKLPLTVVGWSLVGVAIIGMLVFYIVTRNNLPNATKKYIAVVNENLNMRNFMDTRFTNTKTDTKEKMELSDPVSDAIFAGVTSIASRNVITGKFLNRSFRVSDMGLYTGAGRNRTSSFVGKYFSYPNDLHFEGRYIITLKGTTPVDQPTDIGDLVVLEEKDNFVIYGKEGSKVNSDLGKFLEKIKAIKVEKHLLNYNLVVWSGHSAVYASFDDEIMTLPFAKEFDKSANEQYADCLIASFEALSFLTKKGK